MPIAPGSPRNHFSSRRYIVLHAMGSAYILGPAFYVVTAADMHPIHESNRILKFPDDLFYCAGREQLIRKRGRDYL